MLPVSQDFLYASEATVRTTKMRLTLNYVGNRSILFNVDGTNGQSADTRVYNTQLAGDPKPFYTHDWARLGDSNGSNGMSWVLGQSKLAPFSERSTVNFGYWSREISDTDKNFSRETEILFTFAEETNVPFIELSFDDDLAQYATGFDVYAISSAPTAEYEIVASVRNNTSTPVRTIIDVENVKTIKLVPISWSTEYEPFRLNGVKFFDQQIVFNTDETQGIKIVESSEQADNLISAGANQTSTVIRNDNNRILKSHLLKNLNIIFEGAYELADGSLEWIPMGSYYAEKYVFENQNKRINITAIDFLTLIGKERLPAPITLNNTTFENAITTILSHTLQNQINVDILPEIAALNLGEITIEAEDLKTAIEKLVKNAGCFVWVDRHNTLKIYPYVSDSENSVYELTPYNIKQNGEKNTFFETYNNINVRNGSGNEGNLLFSFVDDFRSNLDLSYEMQYANDSVLQVLQFLLPLIHAKRRVKYEIECRGNIAVELGDSITYTSKSGEVHYGTVVQSEYTYNGALNTKHIIKGEN